MLSQLYKKQTAAPRQLQHQRGNTTEKIAYGFGRAVLDFFTRSMLQMDVHWHATLPPGSKIIAANHPTTTDPFLLLLDEPAAGMDPNETRDLVDLILRLRENEDVTIFLIEHDMSLVMTLSERIYVVDYGQLIAQGTPDVIKQDKRVIKAYLGEEVHA